jgi:hypothetical protein
MKQMGKPMAKKRAGAARPRAKKSTTVGVEPEVEAKFRAYCEELEARDKSRKSSLRSVATLALMEYMERHPLPPAK